MANFTMSMPRIVGSIQVMRNATPMPISGSPVTTDVIVGRRVKTGFGAGGLFSSSKTVDITCQRDFEGGAFAGSANR